MHIANIMADNKKEQGTFVRKCLMTYSARKTTTTLAVKNYNVFLLITVDIREHICISTLWRTDNLAS